jgi:molybdate transport system substrate-binding protein
MNQFGPLKFGVLLMLSFALVNQVRATEIKAVFPGAMRTELAELLPQFEEKYGDKVVPVYGAVGAIVARLKNGDKADLVVVSDGALADLIAQGKIRSQGHATVAKVGIGVFMRKDAVKPDIGSVDAFRKGPAVGDCRRLQGSSRWRLQRHLCQRSARAPRHCR